MNRARPRGLLIDFWELIGAQLGRPVEFALTDWDDSLAQVRDGRAHVHGGLFRSPEREAFLDFGVEIFPLRAALFVSASLSAIQASDLEGIPVGVTRGGFEEEFLRTHHPGLTLRLYDNNDLLVRAATRGEVVAFAADYPVGMYLLDRHASPEHFRVLEVLYARHLAFAVAAGNAPLLTELNAAIQRLDPDELSRITQKWMRSESVDRVPIWFWLTLLAGVLGVCCWAASSSTAACSGGRWCNTPSSCRKPMTACGPNGTSPARCWMPRRPSSWPWMPGTVYA
jgi:ABC-type amino acid transport substrate-binding protein